MEPPKHRDHPSTNLTPRRVLIGTVIGSFPFANCYMVAFGDGEGRFVRPCLYIGSMGNFGLGVKMYANLTNGTQVLVASFEAGFDYIIGPVPFVTTNPGANPADFVQQGGGTHFFTEEILRFPAIEQDGVVNAGIGGMLDLMAAEWAVLNELGGGVMVGRFEAFLRADEMCGIWANYIDRTLRLGARDFLLHTYSRDDYDGFADGELNAVRQRAIYPSESVGIKVESNSERQLPEFTEATGRSLVEDRDGTQAAYEPSNPERVLLPRLLELEGRNADLLQRFVLTPNPAAADYLLSDQERYLGLLRERYGLDGSYQLYSKQAISIRKVVAIPAPVQVQDLRHPVKEIEDQQIADFNWGDAAADFGAAGFAAQALEYHAYIANVASYRQLLGRSDWHVPEADAEQLISAPPTPPNDRGRMWQQLPPTEDVDLVGDRQNRYYLANAGLDILPDGTVVIDGPSGEQIIMGGGNIILTCPGSVYTLPGQHAVTWAPGDIVQRAKRNVELSTSERDIRIKAERNLQMLGGNGGAGGVLIESKGTSDLPSPGIGDEVRAAGVVIKAEAAVRMDGDALSLRSREGGVGIRAEEGGDFTLTAGLALLQLDNQITIETGDVVHLFSKSFSILDTENLILSGSLAVPGTLGVGKRVTIEDGGMDINGAILVRGSAFVDGQVVAKREVLASLLAHAEQSPQVANIGSTEELFADIFEQVGRDNSVGGIIESLTEAKADMLEIINPIIESSDEFWNDYDDTVGRLGFTFRRSTDYSDGHADFAIPEPRWQAWLRALGIADAWEEPQVAPPEVDGAEPTIPHPGLEVWNSEGILIQAGNGLWDPETGLPAARDTQQAAASAGSLASAYIINTSG